MPNKSKVSTQHPKYTIMLPQMKYRLCEKERLYLPWMRPFTESDIKNLEHEIKEAMNENRDEEKSNDKGDESCQKNQK